jgi:hypothetical protein
MRAKKKVLLVRQRESTMSSRFGSFGQSRRKGCEHHLLRILSRMYVAIEGLKKKRNVLRSPPPSSCISSLSNEFDTKGDVRESAGDALGVRNKLDFNLCLQFLKGVREVLLMSNKSCLMKGLYSNKLI